MEFQGIDALEKMFGLSPLLATMCKPLFAASPIAAYAYSEFHPDGRVLRVFTDKKFFEQYAKYAIAAREEGEPEIKLENFTVNHRRLGFSLFDLEPHSPSLATPIGHENGLGHPCSFTEKTSNAVVRIHHFFGRLEDGDANDFYLNNTNLLRYFARFIAREVQDHVDEMQPYVLVSEKGRSSYRNWIETLGGSRKVSIPQFLIDFAPEATLSKRQKELIYWSLLGKTTPETALILGVKASTVKKYFERLKIKFQCGSKHLIIAELIKKGICFPDLPKSEYF